MLSFSVKSNFGGRIAEHYAPLEEFYISGLTQFFYARNAII